MQIWYRNESTLLIDTREPHVYSTVGELYTFLQQHLTRERREHWLVLTAAEEIILKDHMAEKSHIARQPEHYLDNMVLSLLRADGLPVRYALLDDYPPGETKDSPKRIAIACNFPL